MSRSFDSLKWSTSLPGVWRAYISKPDGIWIELSTLDYPSTHSLCAMLYMDTLVGGLDFLERECADFSKNAPAMVNALLTKHADKIDSRIEEGRIGYARLQKTSESKKRLDNYMSSVFGKDTA